MLRILLSCWLATSLLSCISHQELVNFRPLDPATTLNPQEITNRTDLTAQPEDLLKIMVSSLNEEASVPFNLPVDGESAARNIGGGEGILPLELTTGYFVDEEGYIDFPILGSLYVQGLTLTEIKRELVKQLSDGYLKNPVINIRFLNLKVTVLGEVNLPGLIRLSNKRVTLLEALGIAGDLTVYADRTSVLVVREDNGERTFERLNLQSEDIFSSPYFYLEQNDVIYVEPINARVATVADPLQRIVGYASAALSLVTLIVAFTR